MDDNSAPPHYVPGLDSLIWPLDNKEFISDYWNKRCFASHEGAGRIDTLAENLNPYDIKGLIEQGCSHKVLCDTTVDRSKLQGMSAIDVYEEGLGTLWIHLYDSSVPSTGSSYDLWKSWFEQVSNDLGRVMSGGWVSIYAAKKSNGLKPHFDSSDNYTIQLTGKKRWYHSDENTFLSPDSSTAFQSGDNIGRQILSGPERHYVHDPHAIQPPPNPQSTILEPGSMLYVPRGFWHWTESLESSISLNISMDPGHWVGYIMPMFMPLLLQDPVLRETAHFNGINDLEAATKILDRVKCAINILEPSDIIPPPPMGLNLDSSNNNVRLRRRVLSNYYIRRSNENPDKVNILFVDQKGQSRALMFPAKILDIMEWLDTRSTPFTLDEFTAESSAIAIAPHLICQNLIAANYLEIANQS